MFPQTMVIDGSVDENSANTRARFFPRETGEQTTAVLYRCSDCRVWWGSSQQHTLKDYLVFRMAEPHSDMFRWEDYRGWRTAEADICPECGRQLSRPDYILR